jgi:flagellar biosynthetic protein FliP
MRGAGTMGMVLNPVFDGSTPMPRYSWTMRLGLWLRRLMSLPTASEMPIRLEGRLNLGPKKSLVLVNCRGKSVLLALGTETITPIMEVPAHRRRKREPGLDLPGPLGNNNSVPWTIVFTLTLLTLLPAILLAMTPMVRLLVVFHFLRQALGTQTAPSNQVLLGLGLMMTWFLMQPVLLQVDQQAVEPYRAGQISGWDAIDRGSGPPKTFMLRYAREKDLALFVSASMTARPQKPEDLPMRVVVPAYMLSELKAGFEIGAVLFLPFLLVDMVVASITTSIGMFQLPPVVISTPLKILLFVMVDGWNLLAGSLLKSF